MRATGEHYGSALTTLIPEVEKRLPQILADVERELRADWPDYAEFLAREQEEVSGAVKAFLHQLIDLVDRRSATAPADYDLGAEAMMFEEIGRIEWRDGRELTILLSAYQVGARIAWRYVSECALDLGLAPSVLAKLAEAVFIFVDKLSSASARGYVREQTEASVTRERLRDELVELLLSGRSDEVALHRAAARAGWPLPRTASVLLIDPERSAGRDVLSRLDSSCLHIRGRVLAGAIVPDPIGPGRRTRLADALTGAGAVVGPPVTVGDLPASFHIAEIAHTLQRTGVLIEDPVFTEEHFDAIIVHRDSRLLAAFRTSMLAPFEHLSASVQERLIETLTSWLRHFGDRQAVAAELHVHPQTVRYRMAQLHDLLGPVLDDPDGRARLMLALAWDRIPRAVQPTNSPPALTVP